MTDDHENHNRADDVDSDLQDGPTSGYSASLEDRIAAFAQQDVSLDDELRKAASKKTDEQRAKERKFIIFGVLGLIGVFVLWSLYSMKPKNGPITYGICATLLELETPYPQTIRHIALEGSASTIRIYFTTIDPFGQLKIEMFECKYATDHQGQMRVTDLIRNRQSMGGDAVTRANNMLPVIMSSDPYRIMPPQWKNPLLNY
jgi:hypothetical protein